MDTITLQTQADSAANELDELKARVTACKEKCRAAVFELAQHLAYASDSDDMGAIFESIDNIAYEDRAVIKARFNEADEEIGNIEEAQLRHSAPPAGAAPNPHSNHR